MTMFSGKVIPMLMVRYFAGLASGRASFRMTGATIYEDEEQRMVSSRASP
jgi:hypothetical protein